MQPDEVRPQIRSFLQSMKPDGVAFSDDDDLVTRGIVDSLGLRDLVAFLEQTFTIVIEDAVFFDSRWSSLNGIAEIVCELRSA